MLIACISMKRHHLVALQCGEECPTGAVNKFDILNRSLQRIEKYSPGLKLFMGNYSAKHILKMIIFSFKINFKMINSVVNGKEVTFISSRMNEVD
jgi:hypothetical protein